MASQWLQQTIDCTYQSGRAVSICNNSFILVNRVYIDQAGGSSVLTAIARYWAYGGRFVLLMVCILLGSGRLVSAAEITRTEGVFFEPDVIRITGLIGFDDFPAFARIAATTSNAILVLDSPGGKVGPTFDIAMLARARGFATYVEAGAICHSGCANIWLAGYRKFYERGGEIALHPSSSVENGKRVPGDNGTSALMGWYYAQLGMPRELVFKIFEMDPLTITAFPADEIQELGIDATPRQPGSLEVVRNELAQSLAKSSRMHILTQIALREATIKAEATIEIKAREDLAMVMQSSGFHEITPPSSDAKREVSAYQFEGDSTKLFIRNSLDTPFERFGIYVLQTSECVFSEAFEGAAIIDLSTPVSPGLVAAVTLGQPDRDLLLAKFGEHDLSCLGLFALVN